MSGTASGLSVCRIGYTADCPRCPKDPGRQIDMPKLLFLSPIFPMPLDQGQRHRVLNLLLSCSRDFDVTFVGPAPSNDDDKKQVELICKSAIYLEAATAPPVTELSALAHFLENWRKLGHVAGPRLLSFLLPYAKVLEGIPIGDFDLIWAERPILALLCRPYAQKTIIDLDDVDHRKLFRELRLSMRSRRTLSGGFFRKCYVAAHYWLTEIVIARRYLACVVCSEIDQKYLQSWGLRNVAVIPNGIELPKGAPPSYTSRRNVPCRLVFVGHMQYPPNIDAVEYFARDVLPQIAKRVPNVTFDVIGSGVSEELMRRLSGRVCFRGFVKNLPDALTDYNVFVAPLRYGGGTKIKVLAAMASRIPISTTPIGAEGLGLERDVSAMIDVSDRQIADSIIHLYDEPDKARRIADRAYEIVCKEFGWHQIREGAADWLQRNLESVGR